MKWLGKLSLLGLMLGAGLQANAQLFVPEAITGAGFGALTGALIAGHHNAGTGAAIGAGAGFVLGGLAQAEREHYYSSYGYPSYGAGYYVPAAYGYPSAYTVSCNNAPAQPAPAAAPVPPPLPLAPQPAPPPSPMAGVNALFGR